MRQIHVDSGLLGKGPDDFDLVPGCYRLVAGRHPTCVFVGVWAKSLARMDMFYNLLIYIIYIYTYIYIYVCHISYVYHIDLYQYYKSTMNSSSSRGPSHRWICGSQRPAGSRARRPHRIWRLQPSVANRWSTKGLGWIRNLRNLRMSNLYVLCLNHMTMFWWWSIYVHIIWGWVNLWSKSRIVDQ